MRTIGIKWSFPSAICTLDIWKLLFIQDSQPVAGSLGWCSFQIVVVLGLFLNVDQPATQVIHHLYGKIAAFRATQILAQEVLHRLIHANDTDSGKVILPILVKTLVNTF